MSRTYRHAFRVFFEDGTSRDVTAQDEAGATRTAVNAQKLIGYKGPACRPLGTPKDLGHRGTDTDYCPRCGGLFPVAEAQ
jgi:hypothetical protein